MRYIYLMFLVSTLLFYSTITCAACIDSADPWTIVDAQDAAYNAHDPEAFADCYSDDAVIEGLPPTGRSLIGNIAIRERYQFLKTAPKNFHTKFINKIIVGAFVIVHEVALGGPEDWPKPDWPKESIAIFEVRNKKVVHVWYPASK